MAKMQQLLELLEGTTARLEISSISKMDLEEVRLLHNEPSILLQLSDPNPVTRSAQIAWFKKLQQSEVSARMVIRNVLTRQLVGVFRLDRIDARNKSVMVGLDVAEKFRRLGFARETYSYMLGRVFGSWDFNRAYLETLHTNEAAIALYLSIGMQREGIGREGIYRDSRFLDLVNFSILRKEWESHSGVQA